MEPLEALYLEALGVGQGVGGGGKRRLPARVPEMEHDPGLLTIKQDADSENFASVASVADYESFPTDAAQEAAGCEISSDSDDEVVWPEEREDVCATP